MLTLTPSALSAVRDACEGEPLALRINVGMGCKGPTYSLGLEDSPLSDDAVIEVGGLKVFLDPDSARLLEGATMDFVEGPDGSGFTFDAPNAPSPSGGSGGGGCGCGKGKCS